jgi:hypothetical protein
VIVGVSVTFASQVAGNKTPRFQWLPESTTQALPNAEPTTLSTIISSQISESAEPTAVPSSTDSAREQNTASATATNSDGNDGPAQTVDPESELNNAGTAAGGDEPDRAKDVGIIIGTLGM